MNSDKINIKEKTQYGLHFAVLFIFRWHDLSTQKICIKM